MIKEFMLASALSLSNSNLFYDLNNDLTRFQRQVPGSYINENDTTNIIIDLNTGESYLAWLAVNDDGVYREWEVMSKEYESSIYGDLNISSYINYLYSNMGFGPDTIYTYSALEMLLDFEINGIDFTNEDYNTEVYISSFFAIPENENTLLQVCDTTTFDLDKSNVNTINSFRYQNFMLDTFNRDLFLVFSIHNLYYDSTYDLDFGFDFLFSEIFLEFEIPLNGEVFSYDFDGSDYSSFIYHDFNSIIERNEDLEIDNSKLNSRIQELIKENDELNSKHAFSNIFEIVRGAFDGFVNFLEVEVMPNITIGTILFIPVVIGVIFFILKALVL